MNELALYFCWRKPEACIEIWRCYLSLQGDIVSCAGTYIHVWSINGSPTASVNTFTGRSQQIMCCFVSEMNEWDTQNVIVTGHSDGVVRVSTRDCCLEKFYIVVAAVKRVISIQHSILPGTKSSPAALGCSTWAISPAGRSPCWADATDCFCCWRQLRHFCTRWCAVPCPQVKQTLEIREKHFQWADIPVQSFSFLSPFWCPHCDVVTSNSSVCFPSLFGYQLLCLETVDFIHCFCSTHLDTIRFAA